MAKTLGSVSLKLEDEVLVKVRSNTTVVDLLEQLDKACKGGRIQDAEGFDVTAHYSQDLPEGDYVIKQPVSDSSSTQIITGGQDVRSVTRDGAAAGHVGLEEIQMLAAFAKDQMMKTRSVRLSELEPSKWDHIQRSAGLLLKPYLEDIDGLKLQSATPFEWSGASEASQADQYLPHIRRHIKEVVEGDKYSMFDARRYPQLLTITGMQDELGFTLRGTTDAALVLQQSISVGAPANGLRWLWELKPQLHPPTVGTPASSSSDSPTSNSSNVGQQGEVSVQSKAACQAMAALLLANIHAPDFKPAITLTDLGDRHSIFWLDGFSIMYYAAPNAATAWALTKALLVWDSDDHNNAQCNRQLPQSVEPLAKRQKFDVHTMRSSGGELAQLAMISDSLSSQEFKRSAAACMVKQLFNMPAFCSEERSPSNVPFGMYS